MLNLLVNILNFLEVHEVAVDFALLERITVHRGRETNLKGLLNFFFLFSEGCETKHLVLDMEHKIESFGLESKGLLMHTRKFLRSRRLNFYTGFCH